MGVLGLIIIKGCPGINKKIKGVLGYIIIKGCHGINK